MRNRDVEAGTVKASKGEDVVGRQAVVDGRHTAMTPDPGFFHNPGKAFFGMGKAAGERLAAPVVPTNPLPIGIKAAPLPPSREDLIRQARVITAPEPSYKESKSGTSKAVALAEMEARLRAHTGIQEGGERVITDVWGRQVILGDVFIKHLVHPSKMDGRERHYNLILPLFEQADEIWLAAHDFRGKLVLRREYVMAARIEGEAPTLVYGVATTELSRVIALTFYREREAGDWEAALAGLRRGALIYSRWQGGEK